jgi:hypothetical protein
VEALMKRWVSAFAAILLVAAAGWFWASPLIAMHALKASAQAGDRDALADEVDFPAVRESLKSQLKAAVVGKLAERKDGSNAIAALGAMFAVTIADGVIDAVISPDGIRTLVAQGKVHVAGQTQTDDGSTPPHWVIERKGLGRFTAYPVTPGDDKPPILVFTRANLSWKLTDIVLPLDTAR